MKFTLTHSLSDSHARAGTIETAHGIINTPVFMPVGTQATVKGIYREQLSDDLKAKIILGNTYHIYLRPGIEIIKQAGGLHRFIGWENAMLTDSGGFQVYSLSANRKLKEEGADFKSHIDGSKHFFTPENVMDIQRAIGADIIMAFDECAPYPCDYDYAEKSMELTHRWLKRCITRFDNTEPLYGYNQTLFPIVQGSTYPDLRKRSAEFIASCDRPGNAIGGVSVGEPTELMYEITETVCAILPKDKPRYLMGVGKPENILEGISMGVDMFDCVMPTRNGRNGTVFTSEGIINLKNTKWKDDFSALDPILTPEYSKAYIKHLCMAQEMLFAMVASMQNLRLYMWLMENAREKIKDGTFESWKRQILPKLTRKL
ncbi:MAG: tRNA guanosine(34) transglycosylase Tgt [Bacteroidia bacterium]|jgi:queuine tRNA-ribosyltransferase|nr:tRNA guanosine(34) transglycosylase Tgt [Bacteroidia bacterium]MCO5253171.1 tRNA guanosine(34) transglycosylase Tgt [Bacteroidota bacterium]MCZ2128782.1 tRNA guanosine(34) transglycosylase Tgt [Bacteroidia bacterium]